MREKTHHMAKPASERFDSRITVGMTVADYNILDDYAYSKRIAVGTAARELLLESIKRVMKRGK